MKRKKSKKLPSLSTADVESLPKTEAVLVRLTKQDKKTIMAACSSLHLTMTELFTRSALMVAEKVKK